MSLNDYSYPVHKSLLKRNLVMGLPPVILILILMFVAFMYILTESFAIVPLGIILFVITREITKRDEYLLEILLSSLIQPDILE